MLASIGHQRAQNRVADWDLIGERERALVRVLREGRRAARRRPECRRSRRCARTRRPPAARTRPRTTRGSRPGRCASTPPARRRRSCPAAGDQAIADAFEPLQGGGACATTSGCHAAGHRHLPHERRHRRRLHAAGIARPSCADITSPGANSQIAARLLDVDPAGNQILVARGLWRPAIGPGVVRQVFQLHANGWRFDVGHQVKLELLPKDPQYGQASNGQQNVTVSNIQLRLPVLEQPGSLGGLVTVAAPQVVPLGVRARGRLPGAVVRAAEGRDAAARVARAGLRAVHGSEPDARAAAGFGVVQPAAQVSDTLTVGTGDANGKAAQFDRLRAVRRAAGQSRPRRADEADVRRHRVAHRRAQAQRPRRLHGRAAARRR